MADVISKVASIRQAVYGEQVREALASGIEVINNEVMSTTEKQGALQVIFDDLIINAGNSNAEIVVARGTEATLQARLNASDEHLAGIANNITNYGGNADGVTTNDMAFLAAKSEGSVYFPQNDTGDAVYYFADAQTLDNLIIGSDEGVIISYPTSNVRTWKKATFADDIKIYSRDKDNYAEVLKNDYSKSDYVYSMDNDIEVGAKKVTVVQDGDIKKAIKWVGDDAGINSETTELSLNADGNYEVTKTSQTSDFSKWYATTIPIETDTIITTLVTPRFIETIASARMCVYFGTDSNNGAVNHIDFQGNLYKWIRSNGILTKSVTSPKYVSLFTDAYKLTASIQISIRSLSKRKFEMYINGVLIDTTETDFDCTEYGFGTLTSVGAESGINNFTWGEITKSELSKNNTGNSYDVITFGDSFSAGSASSLDWTMAFKNMIEGQYGVNKITVENKASGGHKVSQQLAIMNETNMAPYDTVFILIGQNDIEVTPIDDFANDVQAMIDRAGLRRVIIGIPSVFITRSLTGQGIDMDNYTKGAPYRNRLLKLVADNDVLLADTLSEIGRIGVDNQLNILRDNLHPQTWGFQLIARCFARSFLYSISNSLSMSEKAKNISSKINKKTSLYPALQNGWVNYGEGNTSAKTVLHEGNKTVRLEGVLKDGTTTVQTVIAVLPAEYRPKVNQIIPTYCEDVDFVSYPTYIHVNINGEIRCGQNMKNRTLILNGLTYYID